MLISQIKVIHIRFFFDKIHIRFMDNDIMVMKNIV